VQNLAGSYIRFSTNFQTDRYWAIANDNREVYIIMNKLDEATVYFNLKDKRSD